jgi:hypothetical protein
MEQKAFDRVYVSILWGLLIIIFLVNLKPAIVFGVTGQVPEITASIYTPEGWYFTAYGVLSIVNIIALVAIFCWRKWGFYLLIFSVAPTSLFHFMVERNPLLIFSEIYGYTILFGFLYYWKGHKTLRQFI